MKSKKITLALLLFYLAALTWVILFKLQFSLEGLPHIRNINLIPFGASAIVNGKIAFSEIIQNMFAFIPFGIFIHTLREENTFLWKIAPIFFVSLFFECMQFIFSIGASDITDLLSNTVGGAVGIYIAVVFSKVTPKNWRGFINLFGLIGAIGMTLLLSLLLFYNL